MKIENFDNTMKTFQGIPVDERKKKKQHTKTLRAVEMKEKKKKEKKRLSSASGSACVSFNAACWVKLLKTSKEISIPKSARMI